ncbi:MAG: sulfotransferase domain-containing protein, partial [Candidatus Binatia bacterium]
MISPRTRARLAFAYTSTRRPTARWRTLPTLLIIGAQRCGTSSLFKYLGAHPRCKASIRKEVRFFTQYYDRGENWYRSHFPLALSGDSGSTGVTFEASPDYLLDPRTPSRVVRHLPDIRLIAILRNPIERAYSHYRHFRRLGLEELPFEEALHREPERIQPDLERLQT